MLKLVWVGVKNKYKMGWFIHSYKNLRRAEFKRKLPPPLHPQLAAMALRTPATSTQTKHALVRDGTALEKKAGVTEIKAEVTSGLRACYLSEEGSGSSTHPTTSSMPALLHHEHRRGRHQSDL